MQTWTLVLDLLTLHYPLQTTAAKQYFSMSTTSDNLSQCYYWWKWFLLQFCKMHVPKLCVYPSWTCSPPSSEPSLITALRYAHCDEGGVSCNSDVHCWVRHLCFLHLKVLTVIFRFTHSAVCCKQEASPVWHSFIFVCLFFIIMPLSQ